MCCIGVYVLEDTYIWHSSHIEPKGLLVCISSLLPPLCGLWESHSRCPACTAGAFTCWAVMLAWKTEALNFNFKFLYFFPLRTLSSIFLLISCGFHHWCVFQIVSWFRLQWYLSLSDVLDAISHVTLLSYMYCHACQMLCFILCCVVILIYWWIYDFLICVRFRFIWHKHFIRKTQNSCPDILADWPVLRGPRGQIVQENTLGVVKAWISLEASYSAIRTLSFLTDKIKS